MDKKWIRVEEKYIPLITATLDYINKEMTRLYWNRRQKELDDSPFENSGNVVITKNVIIRAYDWQNNNEPNFETENLKVFWYKTCGRGVAAFVKKSSESLIDVLSDTIKIAVEELSEYYNNRITEEQIRRGISKGIVEFVVDPNAESGTVCKIGDNWFYFGGLTAEEESPEEYLSNVPLSEIIREIMEILDDFYKQVDFYDEYLYYAAYLRERGC